jgi:hypothetical protein
MGTMSSIAIELEGIGRILLNRNLAVPIYQRSYAWEDEHVRDLLTDVETAMSEGAHEYFIGSIVTTKNQAARAEVADGQQRLATVTIILSAIRDFFYESGDKERANAITGELLHKKDLRTLALIPKLQLNDADNEYFVSRVLLLPDDPKRASIATKPSHLRIDAAAVLAREHIRRVGNSRGATDRLTEIVEYLTDNVKVIWVAVPDDTNAFMVFETLNDRGLELAITDLLKNHLFGLAGSRLGEVQTSWIGMVSALEAIEEENAVLNYVRHYWSSRQGLVREKDLYTDIKKKINNATRSVSFTADLERNAHLYAAMINTADALWTKYGDTCRQHMETINALRMVQVRPLILSVLDSFTDAELKAALRNIVSWSVRFLIHGGLGSGAIEAHNCAAAKEVRDKKISRAAQLFNRLKGVLPNDAQFRASFATATVSKAYLARYYLRALEQQERGDSDPELVPNPNAEVVNLEHILPQNASGAWSYIAPDEQVLLIKRLGNMVLMKTKINIRAGNDSFAFKKGFYSKSEFRLTKAICGEPTWNRASIEKRQSDLAALAIKTWPLK